MRVRAAGTGIQTKGQSLVSASFGMFATAVYPRAISLFLGQKIH